MLRDCIVLTIYNVQIGVKWYHGIIIFIQSGETIVNMSAQLIVNVLYNEALVFVVIGPAAKVTDHALRVFRVVVMI